jgi:hypothetical protein
MAKHAETARSVAEAACGLGRGESLDEVRPQSLVLAMGGVGWLKEESGDFVIVLSALIDILPLCLSRRRLSRNNKLHPDNAVKYKHKRSTNWNSCLIPNLRQIYDDIVERCK